MSQTPGVNMRGAVDLSSLAKPAGPAPGPQASPGRGGGGIDGPLVVDVTEANFAQTVQLSTQVPVVLDLRTAWAEPSAELSPLLERLAREYGGRFQLGRVDVEASPQIAAAFQVQTVPTVVAVIGGQPVPLFQGAYPEAQVRQVLDELLRVAAENGVTGVLRDAGVPDDAPAEPEEPAEPPLPPLHAEAVEAIEREDYAAAADAYRRALAQSPADSEARAALAQVELIMRTSASEPQQVLAAARETSDDDVAAQLAAADVEVAAGQVGAGFERVLRVVRATTGEDRESARVRLLELFEVVGPTSPEVAAARRALAAALY